MPEPSTSAIHRTDILVSNLTKSKEDAVFALLKAYRKGALALAHEQWRLFFETGRFNKNHDTDKVRFVSIIGASNRVQMARYQVMGALQSWISNRANEFGDVVNGSSLGDEVKHQLRVINLRKAWFNRADLSMKDGMMIPPEVRKLARKIMHRVMDQHRKPNLARISMRLDQRAGEISRPVKATQNGKIGWWINLSTMQKGSKVKIPLLTAGFGKSRTVITVSPGHAFR